MIEAKLLFILICLVAIILIGMDVRSQYLVKAGQAQYIQTHLLETQAIHDQLPKNK